MLLPALILIVVALIVFLVSNRTRKSAGLPGGKIVYADTGKWEKVEKPLYDPITQISGRPDYIVRQGGQVVPVEVKSGSVPDNPYDSHIFQLAAYCLLIEREYGKRPPYGIIHYGKRTFSVAYTQELESALIDLLTEIRQDDRRRTVNRSHDQSARCRGCGFAYTCEQAL